MPDRSIIYPFQQPAVEDVLFPQQAAMIAEGALAEAILGAGPVVVGLISAPTSPASMQITVGRGSIFALGVVDQNAYSTLGTDTSTVMKHGHNKTATTLTLVAPSGSGTSVNYLVQADFSETDGGAAVLTFVNPGNLSQTFAGSSSGNTGATSNTRRFQSVNIQLKAGAAATSGSQATPAVDTGFTPLAIVTVANGTTAITAGMIAVHPQAPYPPFKLPALRPGFSSKVVFGSSSTWTVPLGVSLVNVKVWGGGGGGGGIGTASAGAGGGGGGGGYAEDVFAVTPGAVIPITIGAGGNGGASTGGYGTLGGTSSFGSLVSATGGGPGTGGSSGLGTGAAGGYGVGAQLVLQGNIGQNGLALVGSSYLGGSGGGTLYVSNTWNVAGGTGAANGGPGIRPGGAGGGGAGMGSSGGSGAAGLVIVEY